MLIAKLFKCASAIIAGAISCEATVTEKIADAEKAISHCRVINALEGHSPKIVSTIFVELDTDQSDIDVICEFQESDTFACRLKNKFQIYKDYRLKTHINSVICRFEVSGFIFEIYGAPVPVHKQLAFRHYRVMQRLAKMGGEPFKQRVRKLKRGGLKTEPAISQLLGLKGDPYGAVLQLESWSNLQLELRVQDSI